MILVCVTDQESCDRLIRTAADLGAMNNEKIDVLTVQPKILGQTNQSGNCWLGSNELQYLAKISHSFGANLNFIFHDSPEWAIAEYAQNHCCNSVVIGAGRGRLANKFFKSLQILLPNTKIYVVDENSNISEHNSSDHQHWHVPLIANEGERQGTPHNSP
ncbi:MAG: universal stress protein [Fastidiosipilaceae bacterium]|jgi:K+-sensing histidine kinase KdpD|nr:universal stress protein [Clostridiaceae bacterium]